MFPQPAISVQEAVRVELFWVRENLRVMQYRADQGEDLSALGQSVSSEASGPCDSVGHSHGHQRQQPLSLMQNGIRVREAYAIAQARNPAGTQLLDQLLPNSLLHLRVSHQEQEGIADGGTDGHRPSEQQVGGCHQQVLLSEFCAWVLFLLCHLQQESIDNVTCRT